VHFRASVAAGLPPLAWAARIAQSGRVEALCGKAVEIADRRLLAAAWSGDYERLDPRSAETSVGTGLLADNDGLVAFCGNAGSDVLFIHRGRGGLTLSNALPLALAVSGDTLRLNYPFYNQDLMSYLIGGLRYRRSIPTVAGRVEHYYRSVRIGPDHGVRVLDYGEPRCFASYACYRRFLSEELHALLDNATAEARRVRYRPMASLSTGYDSPAAAVLAREAGCREAFTFREACSAPPGSEDSGEHIGKMLGFTISVLETLAYRRRRDLPEVEFIASGYGGPQVYLAGSERPLANRLIITGFGGDAIWARGFGQDTQAYRPFYAGGYSGVNYHLRLPALAVAVPAIGAGDPGRIGVLSRSAEMARWSIGGNYDRPLPRRIVEEAGVERDAFAVRKLLVTPCYDAIGRGKLALDGYLSPHSNAVFREWLQDKRPVSPGRARVRNKIAKIVGRKFWSHEIRELGRRLGVQWPPQPALLWHLRTPIRENAFLVQWAMERAVAMLSRET
jgi:hypothetical protein